MSEFKLHALVSELLDQLGSQINPEKFVSILQKSIANSDEKGLSSGHILAQNYIESVAENLENPEPFLTKFEELKSKNIDNLGPFVQLLSQVIKDKGTKAMLHNSVRQPTTHRSSELTVQDVPTVVSRIRKDIRKSQCGKRTTPTSNSSILNTSKIPLANTPSMRSWVQRRPSMSWDFSQHSLQTVTSTIPVISQEYALIEDLLNILMGLPGSYIEAEDLTDLYAERTFKINNNVPQPLKDLVYQILPIASHFSIIQRFAEEKMRFEFGQVNNALAEAMYEILKEHMICVTHLETEFRSGELSLQKMWFYWQKRMQTMKITATIAYTISRSEASGGKVLSLLHDHIVTSIGDEKIQQRCVKLMEAACVPYLEMLGMWIYRGIITDPINEFLVEDTETIQKEEMPIDYCADYWDKKYFIRRERVPKFLESVSDIILKAGKYLNVIRQCGKSVRATIKPIQYKIEEKQYIESIEEAYKFASETLLDLFLREKDLIGRLKSVKHYLLLDKGDFIVTFLSLCEKELNRDVQDVVQVRIESLMDLALRLSSANNDPYKDDLKTVLLPHNLEFQMCRILQIKELDHFPVADRKLLGIDSFSFTYEVHWPVSLILNKEALARYQMIFRHLFYCKYVERMICQVWRSNKVAKKFHFQDAQHYRNAFALRQRMLNCVQNLEYHMMVEVVEPHWATFLQKIAKVNNVDEILALHRDFLDNCQKDCMLTLPAILTTITKLLAICVDFCKFMQIDSALKDVNLHPEAAPSFKEQISLFNVQFSAALMKLLDQIGDLNRDTREHERLLNLLYRLDFNGFYTGQFERMGLNKLKFDSSG